MALSFKPLRVSAFALIASLSGLVPNAAQACWEQAGNQYGIPAQLLYAIAQAESSLNPRAVGRNPGGSHDIGLMQVNSGHLPTLAKFGIRERDLFDPCTNIRVGAWILAQSFATHGASWEGVGAYNAGCSALRGAACRKARSRYAWRVYNKLTGQTKGAKRGLKADRAAVPVAPQHPIIIAARVTP